MNKHRYKKLNEQIMVITGATSGIGLATAKRAARAGARLVLTARNEDVLRELCEQIHLTGGHAVYVVGDIGEEDTSRKIVETAQREYGGFDTWLNNAGVAVFSELKDLPLDEHKRLFQTNYWGTVFGSQAAVEHFRNKEDGGTLINIASINSQMPVPILGAYSASKAAVKAYTDVLRMELMHQKAPVKVSVIMPSGISTPISDHGRSHMEDRGKVMPPLYDAELVADAILTAAQRPVRDLTVGGTGRAATMGWSLLPSLMDYVISWALPKAQDSGLPRRSTDNLFTAGDDGSVYLEDRRQGIRTSPYTTAHLHPRATLGLGLLAGAALYLLFSDKGRETSARLSREARHQARNARHYIEHATHTAADDAMQYAGRRSRRARRKADKWTSQARREVTRHADQLKHYARSHTGRRRGVGDRAEDLRQQVLEQINRITH